MCSICSFAADESIFRQGDIRDRLYIIIKVSVTVLKSDLAFGSYKIVMNFLYDGNTSGHRTDQRSEFQSAHPCTASCAAIEHSYFFCILKTSYQDLILSNLMHSIETKTMFLLCTAPVQRHQSFSLNPLACIINQKICFLNGVI